MSCNSPQIYLCDNAVGAADSKALTQKHVPRLPRIILTTLFASPSPNKTSWTPQVLMIMESVMVGRACWRVM